MELRTALWLNISIFCKLNKDKQKILDSIYESAIRAFERIQDIYSKHLIMCQMLQSSQYLTRETAVDVLLKLFLNYSREDNIEFDPGFVDGSFVFIQKIGFANIRESAVPYFRSILIKPSQHLKCILCDGLKRLAFEEFHQELLEFLINLSMDFQDLIQKKV